MFLLTHFVAVCAFPDYLKELNTWMHFQDSRHEQIWRFRPKWSGWNSEVSILPWFVYCHDVMRFSCMQPGVQLWCFEVPTSRNLKNCSLMLRSWMNGPMSIGATFTLTSSSWPGLDGPSSDPRELEIWRGLLQFRLGGISTHTIYTDCFCQSVALQTLQGRIKAQVYKLRCVSIDAMDRERTEVTEINWSVYKLRVS